MQKGAVPQAKSEANSRIEKLEIAVRAALHLRRSLEDVTPVAHCLIVSRVAVARFDAVIEGLKSK